MAEDDPIYYRVYQVDGGLAHVACMQSFDEHDYDPEKFFTGKIQNETTAETIAKLINYAIVLDNAQMCSNAILEAFLLAQAD